MRTKTRAKTKANASDNKSSLSLSRSILAFYLSDCILASKEMRRADWLLRGLASNSKTKPAVIGCNLAGQQLKRIEFALAI